MIQRRTHAFDQSETGVTRPPIEVGRGPRSTTRIDTDQTARLNTRIRSAHAGLRSSGTYLDFSALAKLYVPEAESETLDAFLRGKRDLLISDLAIAEVLSAVARKRRKGVLNASQASAIRDAIFADAGSGYFLRLDLSPRVHRHAERLLLQMESVAPRTLDALHIALALHGAATFVVTYDARMRTAAVHAGLKVVGS